MKVDTNMSIVNKKYVRFMWYPANKVMAKTLFTVTLDYLFRVICFNNIFKRLAQKCYLYFECFLSETISWMFM